jgi:hypothetical protein
MSGSFSAIYTCYFFVTLFDHYDILETPVITALVAAGIWSLFTCMTISIFLPLYVQSRIYCRFIRVLVTPTLLNRVRNEHESSDAKPEIPDKLPNHKGDRNCVVCQSRNSVPASIYSCGHHFACRLCFHLFMAKGYAKCPRCNADRVY